MKMVALREAAEINPRGQIVEDDRLISFVGMAQLNAETARAIPLDEREYRSVSKGYTVFRDGDILAAKITPCWENGKIGQAFLATDVGVGSTEFHVIRADSKVIDDRYLLYFLRQPSIRRGGELRMTGSGGQRRVPAGYVADLRLPLPPLAEQRRIAAILDQADAIRTKRRQALAHLDELSQSIFREMFGSKDYPRQLLGANLDFLTSGSRGWAKYYSSHGDLFIRIQNIERDFLNLNDLAFVDAPDTAEAIRTEVQAGDVLLSITADLGRTAVVPSGLGRAFINQHLAILRSSTLNSRYLSAYLGSSDGARQIQGSDKGASKSGLNFTDIRSIVVPTPPSEVQGVFETRVSRVDELLSECSRALAADDELFASLQSRAFRGEL